MEASVAAQNKVSGTLPPIDSLKSLALAVKFVLSRTELAAIVKLAEVLEDPFRQIFSTETRTAQSSNTEEVQSAAQTLSPSVGEENAARALLASVGGGVKIAKGIPDLFAAAFLASGAMGKEPAGNQGRLAYLEQYEIERSAA